MTNTTGITLSISRGTVVPFAELPNKSIALDGYCQGPALDLENQRVSFDHHDNCVRTFTSATCRQVLDALLLGFDPSGFTVFVNDVDGDTAMAVWLLQNPQRATEANVRSLVDGVANVDAHGPAYPTQDKTLVDSFYQGAMKPESDLRRAKTYGTADLGELLEQCVTNITSLIGETLAWSPREEKERSFEITHTGNGWVMAKSNDFIFDLLYAQGFTKAVAYQELTDGSVAYTVGKKSEFCSGFPVGPHSKPGTILSALNAQEAGWGGGSTIGGAPRAQDGSRSRLSPDQVFDIVEGVVSVVEVAATVG